MTYHQKLERKILDQLTKELLLPRLVEAVQEEPEEISNGNFIIADEIDMEFVTLAPGTLVENSANNSKKSV
jgi:hypothetical protein